MRIQDRSQRPDASRRRVVIVAWVRILVTALVLGRIFAAAAAERHTYRVINRFPHDPKAFTQGLAIHEGVFIEGTGRYGASRLRVVDISTGGVLRERALGDAFFGEGVALAGDRIFQLTWRENTAFVYQWPDLARIDEYEYEGEGWGLAFDGARLIMSDGTDRLVFRDPLDFGELSAVRVFDEQGRVDRLNELEWIEGEIWANQWLSDRVARIDPETGEVRAWVDLDGLFDWRSLNDPNAVLNGLAFDAPSRRIFATGKNWPWIFEIETHPLDEPGAAPIRLEREANGEFTAAFPTSRNARYDLERSGSLNREDWASLESDIVGDGREMRRSLPAPSQGAESAFYRLVWTGWTPTR